MLLQILAIIIKLLLDEIKMSSITRKRPSFQINQLQVPNEPNIHSVNMST